MFGRTLLLTQDLNKGSRATTSATAPVVRPNPNFSNAVNTPVNVKNFNGRRNGARGPGFFQFD